MFRKLSGHSRSGSNGASGSEGSSASLHSDGESGMASAILGGKNRRDHVDLTDFKAKRPASFAL